MTLVTQGIRLSYGSTPALSGVDLKVDSGEMVALLGPSGSGKTSLLYCLSGLVAPDSGSVTVGGIEIVGLGEDDAARVRRTSIGFVFQFAELVPELTIAENVALPLQLLGGRRAEVRQRVGELLDRLGLPEVADRRPDEISGGQAQRAAVARAVAHRPAVVFADEPTGSLDSANGAVVLRAFADLVRDEGSAVVLVTHDEDVAAVADRRVQLRDGRRDEAA